MNKRALSPVVATTLLILLVIVLGAIIFLLMRSFVPEALTKEGISVEEKCKDVSFEAEYYSAENRLVVLNTGSVPIYAVKVGMKSGFGMDFLPDNYVARPSSILAGESTEWEVAGVESGKTVFIVPMLLGQTQAEDETKSYACDESSGKEASII